MKRTLTYLIGGTLLLSQVGWAQRDDREDRRGGGRGQARAAANVERRVATRPTMQQQSTAARQAVPQTRQMVRTERPQTTASTQTRVATRPTQTTVARTDRDGSARSVTSRTAIRSTADSTRYQRDGRDWDRDRDRDGDRWRDRDGSRDRDWSRRSYYRPPTTVYRNWDHNRVYSWDNRRWRWYGGTWVIYDNSPSVVYTSDTLPVVGSSVIASVQEELQEEGYDPGPADGVMGSRTRSAIAEYQDDHNLSVTGRINNSLLRSLNLL